MSDINPKIEEQHNNKTVTATWENIQTGDTPIAVGLGKYRIKSVQILGTLGTEGVVLQGSNDNSNFVGLTDDGSTAISGAGLFNVYENPAFLKPVVDGNGDSSTDITVIIAMSSLIG